MTITVKLGAQLRQKVTGHKRGELELELPPASRVTDALDALGLDLKAVKVMMLNGRPVADNLVLTDGDRLALFPPELAYNMYVAINFRQRIADDQADGD